MQKQVVYVLLALTGLNAVFAQVQNVIVYQQEGKFCGWPANEGIWSWGNEILVGFNLGGYLFDPDGHSVDPAYPLETVQARSLDGGLTWALETPNAFTAGRAWEPNPGRINFTHPDFAMKCRLSKYYTSYDRGKTWMGPYQFPTFDQIALYARTDYVIQSQCEATFFIPVSKPDGRPDNSMAFQTTNGGRTFEFLSWIAPCPPIGYEDNDFCTMPSTVKLSEDTYITVLRQRRDSEGGIRWLDVYKTTDKGKNWTFLSKPVEGNWNPASMIRLVDGRICLTYGWRYSPRGIRAKISNDQGQTWGSEIVLRNDGLLWDLGYPRSVQRPDGKVVTVYYYATEANPQQHIAATIWDP